MIENDYMLLKDRFVSKENKLNCLASPKTSLAKRTIDMLIEHNMY